jgi:hypothetical protein
MLRTFPWLRETIRRVKPSMLAAVARTHQEVRYRMDCVQAEELLTHGVWSGCRRGCGDEEAQLGGVAQCARTSVLWLA